VIEAGVTDAESDLVIPGSIFVNMELWEGPTGAGMPLVEGSGNLLPPAQLQPLIEQAGVHCNTRVVVYSHNSTKALNHAPIVGARLLWALRYAGVQQAVLLDGGLSSWLREGYPTLQSNQRPQPVPVDDFFNGNQQLQFPMHPELCASTEEVEKAVSGEMAGAVLGDVRSWEEFTGQRHSYTYFDSLGRIPDARWARWGDSTYIGGDLWSADQTMIDAHKVKLAWAENGIAEPQDDSVLIFYCGSGWRSAWAWLLASSMGWKNVKNYDGGFLEWSTTHRNAGEHERLAGEPK